MVRGLEAVEPSALELMRVLSANRRQIFFKLRLPSSLPFLFSALKIATASCVIGAIVAEWVGADTGLGYLIIVATFEFRTGLLYATTAVGSFLALELLPGRGAAGEGHRPLEAGDAAHMSAIVLLADQVLTIDAKGTIHTPGAVTIVGTQIRAVGPPPARPTGEVVDLRGCVLLPGLVNTHTHTPMWVFRGLTEDVPRGEWLTGRLLPLERRLGPDALRRSALAGCLELIGTA